jgi:diguanylate cyclase (GGDEF)-like protein
LNKIILPGLALYAVSSSLGLFLGRDPFGLVMMVWLTGFIFLAFTVFYSSLISQRPLNAFPFIALGVILLNFFIQVTGGIHSFLWPAYFLFAAVIAGFSHLPVSRTYAAVVLILAIETANLFAPRHVRDFRVEAYAGYVLSVAGVSLAVAYIMRHIRKKEQQVRRAHEQLLAHARAVDPLADDAKLPGLTREERQAANVDAALKRELTFNGLLEFIYELVPAHTYALFLKERKDGNEVLALRAILSESGSAATIGSAPDFAPEQDQWIVGACAKTGEPKSIDNMTIPPTALGYYLRDAPVRSFFAFPIADMDGSVHGVLAVDSLEQGAFAQETRQILERFTPFFVQIIERIRIAQELNIRASHFQSLHLIGSILNSSLELDTILGRLAEQLRITVPHDLCLFLQYDEKMDQAVVLHKSGRSISPDSRVQDIMNRFRKLLHLQKSSTEQDMTFPVQQNAILFQMMKQWESGRVQAYHFTDCADHGGEMNLIGYDNRNDVEFRTLSCWPLTAGDKFIGAFFLGSLQADAFSELQRNLLDTIMNQVAIVVDNSIMHQRISEMARTDGLTGLLNHRTFMENLSREYKRIGREERPFSILLMDIDKFKSVNDTYGHPVGDLAIKAVAKVLKDTVRDTDFVARYGGEEFAVGMVDTNVRGAKQMAERLRSAVEKAVITRIGSKDLHITLSIGISSFPEDTHDVTLLVDMADNALYQAKRSGRNRVCLRKEIEEGRFAKAGA